MKFISPFIPILLSLFSLLKPILVSLNQVLGAKTSASLYSKGVTSDFLLKRIVDLEKGGEGKNTIEYHVSHKANILDKNFGKSST